MPALFSQTYLGFDAGSSNGLALLEELKEIAPLPDESAFNYTNAILSQVELDARVAEVFRSGWGWEFSEWVNHSPQKAEFLSGFAARLESSRAWEVKRAIQLVAEFKLTNQVPRLKSLLMHTNTAVVGEALSALRRFKAWLEPEQLLPLLNSPDALIRGHALCLLAFNTSAAPVLVEAEVERSVTAYGHNAFDLHTIHFLTDRTNRLPGWMPIVARLQEAIR